MYQEDHDSASLAVTLGIMRDIVTEVARRGVKVSDHLVGCLLKSVYQNPENGFSGDRALHRDDVRRLVRFILLRPEQDFEFLIPLYPSYH